MGSAVGFHLAERACRRTGAAPQAPLVDHLDGTGFIVPLQRLGRACAHARGIVALKAGEHNVLLLTFHESTDPGQAEAVFVRMLERAGQFAGTARGAPAGCDYQGFLHGQTSKLKNTPVPEEGA